MHVLETRLEDRGRGLPSQLAEGGSSEDFERHAVKSWGIFQQGLTLVDL